MAKIGVLISGGGSNLQALIDAGLPIVLVMSDNPGVYGLERAETAKIPTEVVDRRGFMAVDGKRLAAWERLEFTEQVIKTLQSHGVDLVVMAGFMTILSAPMFQAFPNRVINIHPSLLPKFPGAHGVRDALAAGEMVTGSTVHIATATVDDPTTILGQSQVEILPGDTEDSLTDRVKAAEHQLFPQVLKEFLKTLNP